MTRDEIIAWSREADEISSRPRQVGSAEREPRYTDILVQMSGEDGNAFSVMGRVTAALRRGGVSPAEIEEFREEAMSGDYDHLLRTVMKWVQTQ